MGSNPTAPVIMSSHYFLSIETRDVHFETIEVPKPVYISYIQLENKVKFGFDHEKYKNAVSKLFESDEEIQLTSQELLS